MIIAQTRRELSNALAAYKEDNLLIGLVPTMGALHKGHRSLLERSLKENDRTVCSIFVNPTQFTDRHDLEHYPRPVNKDLELLEKAGTDLLFMPSVEEIYSTSTAEKEPWHMDLAGLDLILEGKSRPGHFQGVTQVVNKLFSLVAPKRAYFGQKDYQQFAVISSMAKTLNYSIELVRCPIIREEDGLAMSSRNIHLNHEERADASLIYRSLYLARDLAAMLPVSELIHKMNETMVKGKTLKIDYVTIANASTLSPVTDWQDLHIIALIAVWAGRTRLIDNLFLKP